MEATSAEDDAIEMTTTGSTREPSDGTPAARRPDSTGSNDRVGGLRC
jgi:hypothetical protein